MGFWEAHPLTRFTTLRADFHTGRRRRALLSWEQESDEIASGFCLGPLNGTANSGLREAASVRETLATWNEHGS